MNILFHGWECPPNGGGVGVYMLAMSKALAGNGHRVAFITGAHQSRPPQEEVGGVNILRAYDQREIGSARVTRHVLGFAQDFHADLIEGADHLGECASILRNAHRPPVLIKAHGCMALRIPREAHIYRRWQRLAIAVAMLRRRRRTRDEITSLSGADFLCTPSQRLMDVIEEQCIHLPARRIVLPNPVEPIVDCKGVEGEVPTLLFVGRIEFCKGIEYLPAIFAAVVSEWPDARLEIAGSDTYARGIGSLRRWLERHLAAFGSRIRFLGRLDPERLDEAYRRAWVVIVPSRWETISYVVLEAMARGRAVVGSTSGGIPEILSGTLCPVADPQTGQFAREIMRLLRDADLRRAVGNSGKAKARSACNPSTIAERYIRFVSHGS